MNNDPNWTLRFPRTSREVFGDTVEFEHGNHWITYVFVFAAGVLIGCFI